MARVKYQGSARAKGFRPIPTQNNAPQRILQEANRVAQSMQTQRDAILEDRATQSRAMSDNYKIESAARDFNQQIALRNLGQESAAIQGRLDQTIANIDNMQKIADLSVTAAKAVKAYTDIKDEKQREADIFEFNTNPEYREGLLKSYQANILTNSAALAEANANAVATDLQGARPVETSRVINTFEGFSAGQKAAIVDYKSRNFKSYLAAELAGDRQFTDPTTGNMFTGAEARADERLYNIAAQAVSDSFMQENGFNDLSMEFIAPALENIRKDITKGAKTAADNEIALQKGQSQINFSNSLYQTSDPVTASAIVGSSKAALLWSFNYDYGKATEFVLQKVYERGPDGEFLMAEPVRQAILNSAWGPNDETLSSYKSLNNKYLRESRVDRVRAEREDRNIRELEGNEFFEKQQDDLEAIFSKGNPIEDAQAINTFEEQYREQFGDDVKLPDGYVQLKKQVTNENKEVELELLEQANMGMDITLEQAMSITDDATREAAVKLVRQRENEAYGGSYEDLNKSLKGYAKQLTGTDLSSDGISPMGQLLVPELEADFKKYYDTEITRLSGEGKLELTDQDRAAARQKALEKLQQDVIEGKLGEPNSKYSRKKDTDNNLYEFPNLNLEERAAIARQRYTTGIQSYGKRGDKVFDSRGVILSDSQINKITTTYTKTGVLDIPPVVMKLSEISGELPVDIINRQIAASGNENFEQIKPPSYYYQLKGQNPAVVRLFHEATTPTQRARALAQLPDNLEKRRETTDFEYLVNTIAGVESTAFGGYDAYNQGGSDGGHTAHGSGNSAKNLKFGKPISQLTLGEIRRFHNSQELFATGRYQFIPTTFNEVLRELNLPDNTVFDAKVQDAFFITRLKQRARMSKAAGMTLEEGLRQEWIGLQNLSEKEYRRVVNAARSLLSNN